MKLRDILFLMYKIHKDDNGISLPFVCGGTPRDKVLGLIKDEISDLDITTGDKTVHNLAREFSLELKKKYTIKSKQMDDGHTSVFIGDFKVDFSSNFVINHIDEFLFDKGIKNPTNMERELFSRDFTCNSLLMTLDLKKIKDPTKVGINDIEKKVLKTCLDPDTTFRYNTNRIIRTVYLASKLDFDVDPEIINWISENKDMVRLSSDSYLIKNLDKAMDKNPERAVYLLNKMNLWDAIPITDALRPFYSKKKVINATAIKRKKMYHGTSDIFLDDILNNGIKAVDDGTGKKIVYLTDEKSTALGWAETRVDNLEWRGMERGKPVVIEVIVDEPSCKEHYSGVFSHEGNINPNKIVKINKIATSS